LLVNNYPFRGASVSPYDPSAGLAPHQAVIDFVETRGGLAVWSLPEARDHQVVNSAGFQATIRTDPYPDDLLQTDRFAAFGGLYEDTSTIHEPGREWDQLLLAFLHRRRAAPAWAVGEAAFHFEGQAGKRFGDVQTILLAERKEAACLMEALRVGRAYALLRTAEDGLALDQFHVRLPGSPAAEAGSRLTPRAGSRPEVRVRVGTASGRPLPVETRLVRSGAVVHSVRGSTPIDLRWTDGPVPSGTTAYYRVEVRGPAGHQILSNPIFLSVEGGTAG
jgi:hypothetical protein